MLVTTSAGESALARELVRDLGVDQREAALGQARHRGVREPLREVADRDARHEARLVDEAEAGARLVVVADVGRRLRAEVGVVGEQRPAARDQPVDVGVTAAALRVGLGDERGAIREE